ncbi:hypothetical protein F5K02_07460 [Bacillus amyloliquefaciens]|nr:hypothetical protein F5K02_07460 [Bacillus amyloliquefaciens]
MVDYQQVMVLHVPWRLEFPHPLMRVVNQFSSCFLDKPTSIQDRDSLQLSSNFAFNYKSLYIFKHCIPD